MNFFLKHKEKIIIILLLLITVIITNFALKSEKNFKQNIVQNLRILSCQPNFTTTQDKITYKIKRLIAGFKNYLAKGCNFEELNINIDFKNFVKIKIDRNKAIKNNILIEPREVPAEINFNNEKFRSRIRLKGDLPNHWGLNKQWSFKIELKDGKSINGMKTFSITKLIERQFPDNLIIANQFERLGLYSPKFKIYKVVVNGKKWGLMIAEEQFSNVFLENRKLKDGLVFKLTNESDSKINKLLGRKKLIAQNLLLSKQGKIEVDFYNNKKNNQFEHLKNQETLIKSINTILNSNYDIKYKKNIIYKYFDLKKMANLFANTLVFNSFHSLYFNNIRFYLNPYTFIIEPIPTDNIYNNVKNFNEIIDSSNNLNLIYKILFENENFQNEYKKSLIEIKKNLPKIKYDIKNLCIKFEEQCTKTIDLQNFEVHLSKLIIEKEKIFENLEKLSLVKDDNSKSKFTQIITSNEEINTLNYLNKFIYARLFDENIYFYNLTLSEITINEIEFFLQNPRKNQKCEQFKKKNCISKIKRINLKLDKEPYKINFKKHKYSIKDNVKPSWAEINGKIKDKKFKFKAKLENNKFDEKYFLIENKKYNNKFLDNLENDTFIISGKKIIDQPIIVPKNFNLKILPKSELSFSRGSFIYLDNGNLIIDGSNGEIILKSSTDVWNGIYVKNSKRKSKIINTTFKSTKNFEYNGVYLTGGINFYKSDVKISNSKFINSKAEDAINIIKSDFNLNKLYFENAFSDGIDLDFSNGKINNSKFNKISGDAIDASGSVMQILDTKISNVDDKAISIGEKSNVDIKNIEINNSRFGVVSKDLSKVTGENIIINNSLDYDIMAFQKKSHFGPAFLKLNNVKSNSKIISQNKSEVIINNIKIRNEKFDTSTIY